MGELLGYCVGHLPFALQSPFLAFRNLYLSQRLADTPSTQNCLLFVLFTLWEVRRKDVLTRCFRTQHLPIKAFKARYPIMAGGTQEPPPPIALPRIPITFPPYSTVGLGESHKWLLPASRHYVVPCGLKIILLLNSNEII